MKWILTFGGLAALSGLVWWLAPPSGVETVAIVLFWTSVGLTLVRLLAYIAQGR